MNGWLNGKEILVVENGVLEALDVQTGTLRKSQLKVAKESQVFVR